jgi:CoA:oxalate CoA-transferase
MGEQALSDIKVLDLTHYVGGPYCTKLLADFGAEVVKVEKPGCGDGARKWGPFLHDRPHTEGSGLFLYLNSNKKSITLNLKTKAGQKIFKELVKQADLLVENFSPRVMPSLGLDYKTLEKINPALVMTSISNFGQTGPYRNYKANELIEYALSGWLYCVGEPDRDPVQCACMYPLYNAGVWAALSSLAALRYRDITGEGQHVDVSIMECQYTHTLHPPVVQRYIGYNEYARCGNPPPGITPCKDGYIGLNALHEGHWDALCGFLGLEEVRDDPKFRTVSGRRQNSGELMNKIRPHLEKLLDREKEELFHSLQEWRVPAGICCSTEDIVNCAQLKAREYFVEIDHPYMGRILIPGAPFKMSETPWAIRSTAPLLGEHNQEIYSQLGHTKEDTVRLRQQGII